MSQSQRGTTQQQFEIVVADDRLAAWIRLPHREHPSFQPPTVEEICSALAERQIVVDDAVRARVGELVRLCEAAPEGAGPAEVPERYLVAQGRPPRQPQDDTFEWYEQFRQDEDFDPESDRVCYYSVTAITTVTADTAIGVIRPGAPGAAGVDVFGEAIEPATVPPKRLEVGHGLRRSDERAEELITTIDGRVVISPNGTINVQELLSIPEDVDFETGSIDATISVHVHNAVRINFSVRTPKSLTVGGTIEAANIDVGEDVTCLKGIVGKTNQGYVRAGGVVTARFANEATIEAVGGIRVARSVMTSQLRTQGDILVENGGIIGGRTYARQGVTAGGLGSEAAVATPVTVGVDPQNLARAVRLEQDIKTRTKMADQIRAKVAPLMAQLKRLTAEQRERATELLSKADELEMSIESLEAEIRELRSIGAAPAPPRVVVSREIHPGVCIAIGPRETRFRHVMHGPVVIEERVVDDVTELVAVNQRTGSLTVLKSTDVDLSAYEQTEEETPAAEGTEHHAADEPQAGTQ